MKRHFKAGVPLLFLLLPGVFTSHAQRLFSLKIDSVNRTYLLHTKLKEDESGLNAPFLIILPGEGLTAGEIYDRGLYEKLLYRQAVIALPNALRADWACASGDPVVRKGNAKFLVQMIEDLYRYYKINRDGITIISSGNDSCLVGKIREYFPSIQWKSSYYIGKSETAREKLLGEIHDVLSAGITGSSAFFDRYEDPFAPKEITALEKMVVQGYYHRWIVDVRYGGMAFLKSIRTEMKDDSYLDLSRSVTPLSVGITKWFSDSLGYFLEFSRMPVARQQKINGSSLTIGGGMMRNITIGFKYAPLTEKRLRPYFSLATGGMWVNIRGGKITMNGAPPPASSGSPPRGRPPGNINDQYRVFLHTTLGTGADYRFSKRLIISSHLKYLHSAKFDPLGSVNAMRGFSLSFGAGYVVNAGSIKNLEFLNK